MKIPNKIKVAGKIYTVIVPYAFTERRDIQGQADHNLCIIRVSDSSPDGAYSRETVEETFFHELLHAVDRAYNNGDLDEKVLSQLSEGLYQALNDSEMFSED